MLNWKHSDELSRSSLPRQKTRTVLSANSAWDWMMISLALDLAEEIVDFNSTMLPLRATLQMWYMLFCQPTLHETKWFLALFTFTFIFSYWSTAKLGDLWYFLYNKFWNWAQEDFFWQSLRNLFLAELKQIADAMADSFIEYLIVFLGPFSSFCRISLTNDPLTLMMVQLRLAINQIV